MNQGFCVLEMIFDADSRPIDYCFLEINPVFEKQTGLKDAVGKTALELVPNLEKHWLDLYGNVALTGQSTNFTEGSAAMGRWFEVNAFRAGDENSRKVALLFTDISERKNNEEILKQSEATLQKSVAERTAQLEEQKRLIGSILEASLDGIYALKAIRNADGKITDFQYLFANHNTAALLNRKADEVIGSSMLELIPENRTNGFFDTFCNILETGNILRGETHFITNDIDGWYDYVIVPIDSETVVVTTEDITDKKLAFIQMEEQRNLLDNILKNSSNGISVSQVFRDETGKVVDALTILANDAAVKYIGLPKDIYLSKRATEIEPEIIGSPYYQNCIKTLETGEPFVMQYQMHATGRWLELTVSRLDYHHLIQIFTDVTPIKETQLQLEKSVEDLKRSNQNLEEFAYAASHDLKEPMRKIQLFSDRLKERLHDKLSGEETGFFDRIMNATHRMNALIEDLLLYSHVSRGVMKEDSVDLNQKVKMVLEDLELEIEEKNAVIMVHPLPTVKGHRRQLQQLFQNLIGNAIKYSRKGIAPAVNITSRQVHPQDSILVSRPAKEKKDHYLIEVADNGIGFEQDDAERIFNVFTRLHGMAEYKGTGVGLSIARKVVENHGGLIWAESKPGEGSTFKILLPAE
jgi:signal transduction histidine kinase